MLMIAPSALIESTIVNLPVLDSVRRGLATYGGPAEDSMDCAFPVSGGNLQVGFRGKPEAFGGLTIRSSDSGLAITFDTPRPFEGPSIGEKAGRAAVVRRTIGPVSSIELHRHEAGSEWGVVLFDTAGVILTEVDSQQRVVLLRTLAKLGDVMLSKMKKTKIT